MDNLSIIQDFYKEKNIFVTGGTGFMGKVLIEKLLYTCSNVKKIYILLRPKRGLSIEKRLQVMLEMPLFIRIKRSKPDIMRKIFPIDGDVTKAYLGIDDLQRHILEKEVHIVFHCAATLKLESNLKDAIFMNTVGTKNVLNLVKRFERMKVFIHLSTAFCHVDQQELCEKIYSLPNDLENIIRSVEYLDDNTTEAFTSELIYPHPNTYTFSKRLAEKLIAEEFPNLPCAIVRPSIVTPACAEPLPGWVDNLNGPVGLIVGAGKGVIRTMHCNPNFHAEVIPVDLAVNAILTIAFKIGLSTERSDSIPVYNITQSGLMPITWGEVLQKGKSVAYDYPFESAVWYPDGDIRSNRYMHNFFVFFFHIVPAYFIDLLMFIFLQRRFMVRLQMKISNGLNLLQYFTTREWIFHNTNLLIMLEDMSEKDRLLFPIDVLSINEVQYIKNIILGARQYCMKESLSTLQRARNHQTILYIMHTMVVYSFYIVAILFTLNCFENIA